MAREKLDLPMGCLLMEYELEYRWVSHLEVLMAREKLDLPMECLLME